jgi:hypothetical protein
MEDAAKEIVAYAAKAADLLREKFQNEPEAEFVAWLEIALEREAMVGVAYDPSHLAEHLRRLEAQDINQEVLERLRRTIGDVWAQEKGHTAYVKSILDVVKAPEGFFERVRRQGKAVLGALQGAVVARLLSGRPHDRALAIAALALGKLVQETPPFITELEALEFPPFCSFNAALEETAIIGYQRLGELADNMRVQQVLDGMTVDLYLNRITNDEQYHEAVFRGFSGWATLPAPPPSRPTPGAPLAPPPFTIQAHAAICQAARTAAYGPNAQAELAADILVVDLSELEQDPLIQYLRRYVQEFAEAPQSVEARQKIAEERRGEIAEV